VTTFSSVLSEFHALLASELSTASPFSEVTVIRDLKGVLRVIVKPNATTPSATTATAIANLETALANLGAWFVAPVLSTASRDAVHRGIASALHQQATAWTHAATIPNVILKKLERRLTKDSWTSDEEKAPAWPLKKQTPPIVAFFSFKGGVGRTTALVGCALLLAQDSENKVAVVDLDLEAPGLGPFLNVTTTRGILDVLVDHAVTGQVDLNAASSPPQGNAFPTNVMVFPASGGAIDDEYVEKLGRLDFGRAAIGTADPPVLGALKALLDALKRDMYTHILLDARAGLHDLGGLALHGLAHIDVIVARPSEQTWPGLRHALGHLRRVRGETMDVVLAHAQAPRDVNAPEHRDFSEKTYEIFTDVVYPASASAPAQENGDAIHAVIPILKSEDLLYLKTAEGMPLTSFEKLNARIVERISLAQT